MAYRRPKLLQTNRGLCHPAHASPRTPTASGRAPSLCGHYPASSLLRAHPPGSRLRGPSSLDSGRYLASAGFLRGTRSPSLFLPVSLYTCRRPLPRRTARPQIGLGSACCLRRNCAGSAFGSSDDGASSGRSRVVAARTLAHPAERGFVGGLRRRDFPRRRHPSYAASISYRFRTFTLRIHGYLQASHNKICRFRVGRPAVSACDQWSRMRRFGS
jgi:hypothetical protein